MTLFVWDAKYSIGIGEIDRQHQKLFALFNELYDAMQHGKAHEVVGEVLTGVLDYTSYHFAYEEQLFRQYVYPGEADHRAEHARLTQQAKALAQKLQAGQSHIVSMATLKLLCDWLNNHILGSDRKFAPFLIKQGVR